MPSLDESYLPMTAHSALPEPCTPFPGPMMPGKIEIPTVAFSWADSSAAADDICAVAAPPMVAASTLTLIAAIFEPMDSIRRPSRE